MSSNFVGVPKLQLIPISVWTIHFVAQKLRLAYRMPQGDYTTQQSVVCPFDLYSVQNVQIFDINDDCHLIYHLPPGVNPIAVNKYKYIISNNIKR
jgi:hypothetical protein